MLFPDLALARRLEAHEAWSAQAHAQAQAQLYPQTGAAWLALPGGYAVYCGAKSPTNGVYGWGLSGPVDAADLNAIEAFYDRVGCPVQVRVCPLADPSLLDLLNRRGYGLLDFMNVYAQPVEPPTRAPPAPPSLTVQVATPEQARAWFEQSGAGGDWAAPDGVSFMVVRTALKPGARLYLAWLDGQMVGGGALEVRAGVAALMAAETLPAFRHRGVHAALVHARFAAAQAAGCDLVMVHTRPGADSQKNVLRAGFQLAYTCATLLRPARS
jgi:GNAT superfamily N-acetyltransferase